MDTSKKLCDNNDRELLVKSTIHNHNTGDDSDVGVDLVHESVQILESEGKGDWLFSATPKDKDNDNESGTSGDWDGDCSDFEFSVHSEFIPISRKYGLPVKSKSTSDLRTGEWIVLYMQFARLHNVIAGVPLCWGRKFMISNHL